MSSQVWIPLKGDLSNKGLSAVSVTNNGATVSGSGKIGSCYCFNNNNIVASGLDLSLFSNKISLALWAKISSSQSGYAQIFVIGTYGTSWNDIRCGLDVSGDGLLFFCVSNGSSFTNISANATYKDDQWHHFVATLDGSLMKLYVDGELKNSTTTPYTPLLTNSNVYIGGNSAGEMLNNNGYLNDVRIYDHCLSPKEVKEISQCLMLHYKLNDIAKGFTDICNKSFNVYDNFGVESSLVALNEKYKGHTVYRESMIPNSSCVDDYRVSLGSHGIYHSSYTFYANTKYVFYVYFRPVSNKDDIRVGGTASNIGGWTEIPPEEMGNGWYRVGQYRDGSITSDRSDAIFTSFFTPSAQAGTPIVIDWGPAFLIEGTTEIPPVDDFDNAIEYDGSGFEYNGTVSGNITYSKSTPRHNYCANFCDSNCAIHIGNLSTMLPEGKMTFNIWMKKITGEWSDKGYETILGGPSGFELEAKQGGTNAPVLWLYNWGQASAAYALDVWNMVTFVLTPSESKLYLNGQLVATGNGGSLPSGDYFIGAWNSVSQQNYRGYFSDARIYATELSADDIMELYKTSSIAHGNGSFAGYDFVGNHPNIVFEANEGIALKQWKGGIDAYQQEHCQCSLTDNGYRIYRTPNLVYATVGEVMWGGFVLRNLDNVLGFVKGHSYVLQFEVKGQSSNYASDIYWTNQAGWGGGGLDPSPSNVVCVNPVGTDFNSSEWKTFLYKWTITDDIYKTCTYSYSSFTEGNVYMSYRDFKFGFGYTDTGSLGTDLYIKNLRMYDITDGKTIQINKSGVVGASFVEGGAVLQFINQDTIFNNHLTEI